MKSIEYQFFKGLADPTRFRMVTLLHQGEMCVCEIMNLLSLPQSSVSRHMGNLKAAGLVTDRRDGRWVFYRLAEARPLIDLADYFNSLYDREPFKGDAARATESKAERSC